jgi:hypothetical protein
MHRVADVALAVVLGATLALAALLAWRWKQPRIET